MNVNIGDVYGDWTVTEIGQWASGKMYICTHTCGAARKFQRYQLDREKQPCKKCEARAEYRKNAIDVIISSEYRKYKHSAKRRGYEFDLDKEEFESLVKSDCNYCGQAPSSKKQITVKRRSVWHEGENVALNGIDRVDNSRGYFTDNVVSCCSFCNYAKRDRTHEEFLDWLHAIALKYAARA
jgi:hypothetical protein